LIIILLGSTTSRGPQANVTFEGILSIVWGDPRFGSGGETRYTLNLPDGRVMPLQVAALESAAVHYLGKRVAVSGRLISNQFATARREGASAVLADSFTIAPPPANQSALDVLGTRKVIYLLLKFSDDTDVPHPPDFYLNLTNPDTPPDGEVFAATINGFFKKTSWNQFSWTAAVGGMGGIGAPDGWITLPHPKSHYAPCNFDTSCVDFNAIGNDGTALGRAQGITFTEYDNINFVLSNDLDCCAWGGNYFSSVDQKSYGATWEPPWAQETSTYIHEMGHSLGLPHSGWVYSDYDSPWDMMSARLAASFAVCGSYFSRNDGATTDLYCDEPGNGFITPHKDFLGWIPAANKVVTTAGSTVSVTLEGLALPLSSAIKLIKICLTGIPCSGPTARYFTVEARTKGLGAASQYDNAILSEGIVIHEFLGNRSPISGTCFFNNQSGWALPVDSSPGDYDSENCDAGGRPYPDYALNNAQWSPGQTYTNNTYGFQVQVGSKSGSTYALTVIPSKQRRGQITSN
jgi:hypothetical protein